MDANADKGRNLYNSYLLIFLSTFLFYILIQLEILFYSYWDRQAGFFANAHELVALCFSQNENLLLALLYVALFALCRHRRWQRLLCATWLVINLLFLVANQLFYEAFFQPIQIHAADMQGISVSRFLDSFASRLDALFFSNLLLTLALAVVLYRQLYPQQRTHTRLAWSLHLVRYRGWYGIGLLAVALVGFLPLAPKHDLARHPIVAFAASLLQSEQPVAAMAQADPELDIKSLRYGDPASDQDTEAPLLDYIQRRQAQERQPNILYFVLESVGSNNLLPRGKLDPKLTPNLASYAPHSILFPSIDVVVPGTEHAHLGISTGGVIYTGQGRELATTHVYTGPTLVGEMKGLGYTTALFSAAFMDSENFLAIYRGLPFDVALVPDYESESYNRAHLLNSWGINEKEVSRRATQWLDTQQESQPFFLLFLTSNTHHPYSVPEGSPRPFQGKDDLTHYRNALHFADQVIGQMVEYLRESGRLNNTLVVISGDRGEAFGLQHPTNFFHTNYLYEENIKNFLMILDFTESGGPILSSRRGEIGDVMPTLLALSGQSSSSVEGQNLFSPHYQETIRYFLTTIAPQKWGLRDGKWKFITHMSGANVEPERGPELYDLTQDPTEQNNLAALMPDQVNLYQHLLATWYIRTDQRFVSHLAADPHTPK